MMDEKVIKQVHLDVCPEQIVDDNDNKIANKIKIIARKLANVIIFD